MPIEPVELVDNGAVAAKGKGCTAMVGLEGATEMEPVFLGGVGTTSLADSPDALPGPRDEVLDRSTLAVEWVANRNFGKHPTLGEVWVRFHTMQDGGPRSSAVVIAEEDGSLLPGILVNTLYFDLELKDHGTTLFNRDPFVLRSRSENLSPETIRRDPRVRNDPEGTPRAVREILEGGRSMPEFRPVGVHQQQRPLGLYAKEDPDRLVGHMADSRIDVVAHYGLEIELVDSEAKGTELRCRVRLHNLTERSHEVYLYVDALGRLELSERSDPSPMSLGPRGSRRAQAEYDIRARVRKDVSSLGPLDCLLVSACNLAEGMDDFVSASAVLGAGEFSPDSRPKDDGPRLRR